MYDFIKNMRIIERCSSTSITNCVLKDILHKVNQMELWQLQCNNQT